MSGNSEVTLTKAPSIENTAFDFQSNVLELRSCLSDTLTDTAIRKGKKSSTYKKGNAKGNLKA